MSRTGGAALVGMGIGVALSVALLTTRSSSWLLYPTLPGIAVTNFALWVGPVDWWLTGLRPRIPYVVGNAAFYAVVCYAATWSSLRWRR